MTIFYTNFKLYLPFLKVVNVVVPVSIKISEIQLPNSLLTDPVVVINPFFKNHIRGSAISMILTWHVNIYIYIFCPTI